MLNTPYNLTAVRADSTTINLAWQVISADEDGFKIERMRSDETEFTELASSITQDYIDTVSIFYSYFYRVKSYIGNATSSPSNVAEVVAAVKYKYETTKNTAFGGEYIKKDF